MGKQKGTKKSDPKSTKSDDQEENDEVDLGIQSTNRKKVSRLMMLADEEDVDPGNDDDEDQPKPESEDEEDTPVATKPGKADKKSKKEKRKKKKDDDDEDLDAMLAELALEIEGKKPPPKPEDLVKDADSKVIDSKGKDKQATKPDLNIVDNVEAKEISAEPEDKLPSKADKKKAKKKADKEKAKTEVPEKAKVEAIKTEEPIATVDDGTTAQEEEGDEDDNDGKSKKDKKKGKKDKKEKEVAKKGPGQKLLLARQEALKKFQEEQERLEREEEERIRKKEEEENRLEEEARLEREKKEKKKQKEKERIERQKKEGTYMTAKQKEKAKRAKAMLEMLELQGIVPGAGKMSKTRVKKQNSEEKSENGQTVLQNEKVDKEGELVTEHSEEVNEESEEEILDNWEELGETVEVEKPAPVVEIKSKPVATPAPVAVPVATKVNSNKVRDDYDPRKTSTAPTGMRSPIICVLGHVDTGKTKLLDFLRKTHVQDNEAGGITQQIGATFVPPTAIDDQCKIVKKPTKLNMPGLLIIDTPGHESFTNLRSRGSSLCDLAILVIDIMHGLEPQTIESINLLKSRKTPFLVALNKVDRLYNWKKGPRKDIEDVIRSQETNTKLEFDKRAKETILQLNQEGLNAALFFENPDVRSYISLVPTSAMSGDGMGNLINLLVSYSQTMLHKKLVYDPNRLECTVLEVKAIPGLGTTMDVILVNGKLNEGDRIVLAGHDGPIVTHIRSLLVPQALRELRVKSPYQELKTVYGSMGIKVTGQDLEKAVAGLELSVAKNEQDMERLKAECVERFGNAMKAIKTQDKGVYVQASTLGSLEALLEFLKQSKIPFAHVRIGPVVKRDVMKASTMLENSPDYAVILAFDVRVEKDAQDMAESLGVKIFTAEIIYHLFDKFTAYREELKAKQKEQFKSVAVFPCKMRILPQFVFNARDPIVLGVSIEDGVLMPGTPIAVPSKGNI